MSEVEWPEPSSRAPQSPTTEPGAELPADEGAIPAEAAAAEDSAASQIQPELTEEAATGAVGTSEAVLEGAVEGADDDELEEVLFQLV